MLKYRDFSYKGLKFHLNDRRYHNEFTPKYCLLMWREDFGYWEEQIHVNSKAEAMRYIKECERLHCRMFAV